MDSGDLLTTCASSGATLVAIIGGFLLTRYMAVEGEIRGADRVVAQAEARHSLAEIRVETAGRELADYDLDDEFDSETFIDSLCFTVGLGEPFTVEKARGILSLGRFTDEDLDRRLKAWTAETVRARSSDVWASFPKQVTYPTLEDFLQGRVEMAIEPIWARLYELFKDRSRQKSANAYAYQMDDLEVRNLDAPRRSSFENRLHDAVVARDSIAAEVRMAKAARTSIARPDGLRWEVIVLLIVAILTIVPSLLLLTPRPADLTTTQGAWVVGSFLAGFALLIGYLMTHANRARKAWTDGATTEAAEDSPA